MSEKPKRKLWYVRRKEDVRGPFPTAAISQYLVLGRLHPADEVSLDKEVWQKIGEIPELTPEVLKADLDDPVNQSNLEATRRGDDERTGEDRREHLKQTAEDRRRAERRAEETADMMEHRQDRASRKLKAMEEANQTQMRVMVGVLVLVLAGLGGLFYLYEPDSQYAEPDCATAPAPGVNWSNCKLNGDVFDAADLSKALIKNAELTNTSFFRATLLGVDMSYSDLSLANLRVADLSGASLLGATLRNSDLRGANLSGADLSYADLSGARVNNIRLDGAKLDRTIWIDGRECAIGSIGKCL